MDIYRFGYSSYFDSLQALFIVRPVQDGFWAFFYTPTDANGVLTVNVPANSVYTLFTKPSSFQTPNLSIALESPVFSDPVLLIQGVDKLYGPNLQTNFNFYKFDVKTFFNL